MRGRPSSADEDWETLQAIEIPPMEATGTNQTSPTVSRPAQDSENQPPSTRAGNGIPLPANDSTTGLAVANLVTESSIMDLPVAE